MLKRFLSTVCLASLLGLTPTYAQTTAAQVVDGYYATAPQTNCTVGPCYLQYGASLPVTSAPVTVTSATVSAPGTGYVPGTDAGTVIGGAYSTAAALSITDTQLVAATVNAGGSSCTNGSGKTLTGTTGTGTKFQVSATASGNAIVSIQSITVAGDYTVNPTSLTAEPITGDSCSGTTLALTMGALKASVSTAGNYTTIPTNPVSLTSTAGSGVGSTWTLAWAILPPSGNVNVIGNVGGYEFNASVIPTVQNASYTAGQSLGGLQTMSIGSTNSLSGILTQIQAASKGGSTTGIVAYVWSKNPSNTTCTDRANFVVSQADNEYLVVQPQLITPAVIVSGQDTITYAAATNLIGNFVNGSTNTDLYACFLTNATVTPASTTDLRFNLQGIKDAP